MKKLKNVAILALVLVMVLALCAGCKDKPSIQNDADTNETHVEQMTEEPAENDTDMQEDEEEMTDEEQTEEEPEMTELALTLEELKMYDGTNGNPAYVAYDGIIYDVTNDPNWSSGSHGGNAAGTDITEKLNNVSHGTSKLSTLEVVGKIID